MKKLIIWAITLIFLVGTVSAFEFDNVKKIESFGKYERITIKNAFGLGSDLAIYTLEKNSEACLINCWADGTVNLKSDDKIFSNFKFKSRSGTEQTIPFKIYTEQDEIYEVQVNVLKNITETINGTKSTKGVLDYVRKENRTRKTWKEYNYEILKSGLYKWRLEGTKGRTATIDWVASALGVEFDEWAWWNTTWKRKVQVNRTNNFGATVSWSSWFLHIQNSTILGNMDSADSSYDDVRVLNCAEDTELEYKIMSTSNSTDLLIKSVQNSSWSSGAQACVFVYYNATGTSTTSTSVDRDYATVEYGLEEIATKDDTHGTNNISNSGSNPDVMDFGSCQYGKCLFFDAANTEGIHGGDWFDENGFSEVTFTGWAYSQAGGAPNVKLAAKYAGGGNGYAIEEATANADVYYTDPYLNPVDNTFVDNEWHFGAWQLKASNETYYVDGVYSISNTNSPDSDDNSIPFSFGYECTNSGCTSRANPYEGRLDEFMIWNRFLERVEIEEIYEAYNQSLYKFGAEQSSIGTFNIEVFQSTPSAANIIYGNQVEFFARGSSSDNSTFWLSINLTAPNGSIMQLNRTNINTNGTINETYTFNHNPEDFGNWTAQAYLVNDTSTDESNITFEIRNFAPNFTSITLNPTTPIYNDTFNASATIEDYEAGTVTLWVAYRAPNGTIVVNVSFTDSNTTATGTATNWILDNGQASVGEWSVIFTATDNPSNTTYSNFTVNNSAPSNPVMLRPSTNITTVGNSTTLICGNSTDPQNDTIRYEFYADISNPPTTLIGNLTGNISNYATANLTGLNATTYYARCRANDGVGANSNYTSARSIKVISFFGGSTCTGTNATQALALNITYIRETNDTKIDAADFGGTFHAWADDRNANTTITIDEPLTNETRLCISPADVSLYIDSEIQYTADSFDPREYYHRNTTVNNVTQNLSLSLLDITLATGTTITVEDKLSQPFEGVYIEVERKDFGTNTYQLRLMGKTNDLGEDYLFLRHNDAVYRFRVYNYTALLFLSADTKISQNTYTITIDPDTLSKLLDQFDDVTKTLTFDNSTNTFTLTFSDSTGAVAEHCLHVIRRRPSGDSNVSKECLTTSSGTITTTLGNITGTFIATYVASINPDNALLTLIVSVGQRLSDALGKDGPFYAILIFTTLTFAGIWNPVVALVLGGVGLFVIAALEITSLTYGTVLGLFVVIILMIWKMKS